MERPARRGLRGLRLARADVLEWIIVAIVFGTGFTLLLRAVPDDAPQEILLAIGVALVVSASGYVLRRRIGALSEESDIRAFFVHDPRDNTIVDVEGYEFASELTRIMRDALAEDPGLRAQWDAHPVSARHVEHGPARTAGGSDRLIEECVEYMLLEELSMHLIDYFEGSRVAEERLVVLGRDDLADVVAGNRVLELFSRPLAERGIASTEAAADGQPLGVVFGDGYMFTPLHVRLPNGATVRRMSDGLEVDSPVVMVRMRASFEGLHANLTSDFAELYLGDREARLRSFAVGVEVRTVVKRRALMLRSTWDYFDWVDEFRAHLEQSWSGEGFFERIRWPAIRAFARVMEVAPTSPRSGADRSPG